jgi:hypothetical protein
MLTVIGWEGGVVRSITARPAEPAPDETRRGELRGCPRRLWLSTRMEKEGETRLCVGRAVCLLGRDRYWEEGRHTLSLYATRVEVRRDHNVRIIRNVYLDSFPFFFPIRGG